MRLLTALLSIALAQLSFSAFAQVRGEVDPAQSKAVPSERATPAEKAAAKQARKTEGAAAAKAYTGGETPSTTAKAKAATKEERQAARQQRKAAIAPAVKKGEIPSGEQPIK